MYYCNRKNSITVNDNTSKAECLANPFTIIGKASTKTCKKTASSIMKSTVGALKLMARVGTVAVSKFQKSASSLEQMK